MILSDSDAVIARFYIGEHDYTTHRRVAAAAALYFEGATVTEAIGVWRNETERSTVIEVIEPSTTDLAARAPVVARQLAIEYDQDAVLVVLQSKGQTRSILVDGKPAKVTLNLPPNLSLDQIKAELS
jgi:hypothetical protein